MTVVAEPIGAGHADAFDLNTWRSQATVLLTGSREELLLRDGRRTIRLSVGEGSLLNGPVHLRYGLSGVTDLEPKLLTLRRLSALCRLGRMPARLFRPNPRRHRWLLLLRTIDALQAGTSHREIAVTLFGAATVDRDWSAASSYLRLRVQRLVRSARSLLAGGHLRLLNDGGRGAC